MKSNDSDFLKKMKKQSNYFYTFIFVSFSLFFLFLTILVLFSLYKSDNRMRLILNEKNTYLDSHKKETFKLFQNIFPDAAMCEKDNNQLKEACAQETREKIDTEIDTLVSYNKTVYNCLTNENSKLECINTGRLPMYFIKLNKDENIEKLYQSGDYTIEIVDNKYEKKVVAFLKGEQYPFPFPLYTCCGGDDWLQLIPFLPKRVYLNDFPSEMEYILPVKNESGEILGAVVWLYGD